MRYLNLARILWALVTLSAIVATYADTASRGPVLPLNFFGYFTIQSNLVVVIVGLIAGLLGLAKGASTPRWVVGLRALASVCMVVVGLIYITLLAPLGAAGGVPLPWANWVMHIFGPLLVLADWLLARDRTFVLPGGAAAADLSNALDRSRAGSRSVRWMGSVPVPQSGSGIPSHCPVRCFHCRGLRRNSVSGCRLWPAWATP